MDNLKEERLCILELLKEGKITSEQASNLLDALHGKELKEKEVIAKKSQFRMLRIKIDSSDGEKVRVNIPVEFAKLLKNKRFGSVDLNDFDIDMDLLMEMVNTGAVGSLVDIIDEEGTRVSISIE